jgi:hypothetical protein
MSVIVFHMEDGRVAVMYPAVESGLTLEQVAQKDVPKGASWRIVDALPTEPQEQWVWTESGPLGVTPPLASPE